MPEDEGPYECNLPVRVQKQAEEELGEVAALREKRIAEVRDWLKDHPHIRARTDNITILRFLRGCKFDVRRAEDKMEMYYSCKAVLPDMFSGRDPLDPSVARILRLGLMVPLPGVDHLGRKVILGRLGAWDPNEFRPEELIRGATMLLDVLFMEEEAVSVTGFVQLHDMASFSFRHASTLTLPLVKQVMTTWTEGYPTRPKAVHYINTPPSFTPIFNLFRKFMKEKMKKRVRVHGSYAEMQEHVPVEMLPAEYGGTAGGLEDVADYWVQKIESYRDWFLEDEDHKVTDERKPKSMKKVKEMLATQESFRQLEID